MSTQNPTKSDKNVVDLNYAAGSCPDQEKASADITTVVAIRSSAAEDQSAFTEKQFSNLSYD